MTKKLMMAFAALAVTFGAWAATWTDSDTGYTWTYRINGDTAEIMVCINETQQTFGVTKRF